MAIVYGSFRGETLDAKDGVTGGHDEVYGFDGDDHLYGLGGDDLLKGGGGGDHLYGGDGFDTADYRESNAGVQVYLSSVPGMAGYGIGGTAQGDRLDSIEDVIGSDYGDVLYGNGETNFLNGGGGLDVLVGFGGNDELGGGQGDDWLTGGSGSDYLVGGPGWDGAIYYDSPVGVWVSLMPDPITGLGYGYFGEAEGDTLYQVETLVGSRYGDVLVGDDWQNSLQGVDGDDFLYGNGGGDTLLAGPGRDQMTGGDGGDVFFWWALNETSTTPSQMDVITDFSFAAGDRLELSAIDANVYAGGDQAFIFIGTAAFTLNLATPETTDVIPGEIRYYYAGGNTIIEMQTGTSSDIEGGIVIEGMHTPTADWFLL